LSNQPLTEEEREQIEARIHALEIEHRLALEHSAGHRRHVILQRLARHHLACFHPGDAVVERDPGAGDRGGARAAVGLQHVAVDRDLPFAERHEIGDGS